MGEGGESLQAFALGVVGGVEGQPIARQRRLQRQYPRAAHAALAEPLERRLGFGLGRVHTQREPRRQRRLAQLEAKTAWRLDAETQPGRWMVYMGRFADADALAKKRNELRALGVSYDRPGAALEPGLSLGRFSTEEAAQRALTTLGNQGVRSARVLQERADTPVFVLRLPAVNAAMRDQLTGPLRPALAGRTLRPCN